MANYPLIISLRDHNHDNKRSILGNTWTRCRKIPLYSVALTSQKVDKSMTANHDVGQEEFQMVQLPAISTEQLQEHLIYKHMSSAEDHPWSKPTWESLSVTKKNHSSIYMLTIHPRNELHNHILKY